jgi:hypothetical protein
MSFNNPLKRDEVGQTTGNFDCFDEEIRIAASHRRPKILTRRTLEKSKKKAPNSFVSVLLYRVRLDSHT